MLCDESIIMKWRIVVLKKIKMKIKIQIIVIKKKREKNYCDNIVIMSLEIYIYTRKLN